MKIKTLISLLKEDCNRPAACSRPVIIDGHRFLLSTNSKLFLVEDGTAKVFYAYGTDTYPLQTQHGTAISSDPDRIAYLSPIYQNGQILVPLFTRIDGRPFHNIDILDMEGRLSLTIRVPAVEPSSIRPVIYSSSASIFYIDYCSIRIFSWDGSLLHTIEAKLGGLQEIISCQLQRSVLYAGLEADTYRIYQITEDGKETIVYTFHDTTGWAFSNASDSSLRYEAPCLCLEHGAHGILFLVDDHDNVGTPQVISTQTQDGELDGTLLFPGHIRAYHDMMVWGRCVHSSKSPRGILRIMSLQDSIHWQDHECPRPVSSVIHLPIRTDEGTIYSLWQTENSRTLLMSVHGDQVNTKLIPAVTSWQYRKDHIYMIDCDSNRPNIYVHRLE